MLSKKLRLALRRLISALDSGSLNLKPSIPSRIDKRARPFSLLEDHDAGNEYFPEVEAPLTTREWTDDEGKALVEGLQRYQGMLESSRGRVSESSALTAPSRTRSVRQNRPPLRDTAPRSHNLRATGQGPRSPRQFPADGGRPPIIERRSPENAVAA